VTTFEQAGFPDFILERIEASPKLEAPTPIQMQVWPAALSGHDLIGIAETGSGKTLAYMLPMVTHIIAQPELLAGEGPVGVVLAPTRELAHQIDGVAKDFAAKAGLKSLCIFGGGPVKEQGWELTQKQDIVVATPGRFIQFLNDGWTNLNRVTYIVLDEADEMLTKGFTEQINLVMSQVRPDRQILMFSATWPKDVQALAKRHCKGDPLFIRVGGDKLAACRTIGQTVLVVDNDSKFTKLYEALVKAKVLARGSEMKCLVFCKTKRGVEDLAYELKSRGVDVATIHGDKNQEDRTTSLKDFKDGLSSLMICTDVLGRGHDIPRVKMVINYDLPNKIEDYVHRIGRTGRAGEQGYSLTLVTDKDWGIAADLVQVLRQTGQTVSPKLAELAAGGAETNFWDNQWSGNGGDWQGGNEELKTSGSP